MESREKTVLLALLAVLAVSGCRNGGEPPPVLRVGHAPHDHHAPLYVAALEPGYFEEHGDLFLREVTAGKEYDLVSGDRELARVAIDSSVGGKELIRKLAENHFDMSFGGVPAMLAFIDGGSPIRIVSPVMAEGAGLVVPKDLPVEDWDGFLSFLDKREEPFRVGFKIGVSVQNLIFEHALREVGISYGHDLGDAGAEVILVNVHGPKNLIPSMESGLIDGFVIMQPYLALAEEAGVGKTIAMLSELPPRGRWEGNPCCALAASEAFLENQGEAAEAFVTLIMRANAFIEAHPAKSAGLVAEWLGMEPVIEETSLPTIDFTVDVGGTWEKGVDFWIETMVEGEVLEGPVKEAFLEGTHRDRIYDLELYRRAREQAR